MQRWVLFVSGVPGQEMAQRAFLIMGALESGPGVLWCRCGGAGNLIGQNSLDISALSSSHKAYAPCEVVCTIFDQKPDPSVIPVDLRAPFSLASTSTSLHEQEPVFLRVGGNIPSTKTKKKTRYRNALGLWLNDRLSVLSTDKADQWSITNRTLKKAAKKKKATNPHASQSQYTS